MKDYQAFTATCDGIATKLICDVILYNGEKSITVPGQWDTGATNSSITHDVVKQLSLIPIGYVNNLTPSGNAYQKSYLLNITLPNHLNVTDVRVSESEIGAQGIGILLGMDIIRHGDFSISNYDGHTVFTFRYPSVACTDYVKLRNTSYPIKKDKIMPNDLCPCGSGKKYKRCCGKN